MPALPELLVVALALVALLAARESAIDAPDTLDEGALVDDETPLDDIILYSLV